MSSQVTDNEIHALIHLLDDTDNEIIQAVSDKLVDIGEAIIPKLEYTWGNTLHSQVQERVDTIIAEIQYRSAFQQLTNWKYSNDKDLLAGAVIIARFQYPNINLQKIVEDLNRIKNEIWLEINPNLTALEKVKVINHILYEINKFSGNFSNYYAPQNYYINQVIETRKGNPVSLGIIYMTLAQWLDLPIYGVNLPKNFILAYKDIYSENQDDSILFYINPFNKGTVLGRREIDFFLQQQNITPNTTYYYPCSNQAIIERLIQNLANSYESVGQQEKVKKFQSLLDVLRK